MIVNLPYFRDMKAEHAKEIISLLLQEDEDFSILCTLEDIEFNPPLPEHITKQFTQVILFAISNYTLQSAHIKENNFIFEAGFGEENIGSVVTVGFDRIAQITQDEIPLFINTSATLPKEEKPKNPFALNPRNKKLIRD